MKRVCASVVQPQVFVLHSQGPNPRNVIVLWGKNRNVVTLFDESGYQATAKIKDIPSRVGGNQDFHWKPVKKNYTTQGFDEN